MCLNTVLGKMPAVSTLHLPISLTQVKCFQCRVAYLTGELLKYLVENAKECRREDPPKITDLDQLCVQIAGLCRNLGESYRIKHHQFSL